MHKHHSLYMNGQIISPGLNLHWKRPYYTARPSRRSEATPGFGGRVKHECGALFRRQQSSVPCLRQLPHRHVAPQTMRGFCCRGGISRGQGFGRHRDYGRDYYSSNSSTRRVNSIAFTANYVSPRATVTSEGSCPPFTGTDSSGHALCPIPTYCIVQTV